MRTTHQIVLDDRYIAEAQRMSIASNKVLKLIYQTWWVWWTPRLVMVGLGFWLIWVGLTSTAWLAAAFLVLSIGGEFLARRTLAKTRARTRAKGSTSTISMDDAEITVVGAYGNSQLKWPAMLPPAIYPDGVLIKFSRLSGLWLPDQALTEGSPADVRKLLSDNVNNDVAG